MGAMFALWPFNSVHSLMILVSGSIADFSRTLEAAWLAVCGHHVLLGSRSGQTHSLTYTHTHTLLPFVRFLWSPSMWHGRHGTRLSHQLQRISAQHSGSCGSDLPWWNLRSPLSPPSLFPSYKQTPVFQGICVSVVKNSAMCTEHESDKFGFSLLPFMWFF